MARCETCGNDYDKAFEVTMNGTTHTFDSFECAIHALAPTCRNCGIHIVGHGLEKEGTFFCCEHCAEVKGVIGLRDRIGAGGVIEMGSRAQACALDQPGHIGARVQRSTCKDQRKCQRALRSNAVALKRLLDAAPSDALM